MIVSCVLMISPGKNVYTPSKIWWIVRTKSQGCHNLQNMKQTGDYTEIPVRQGVHGYLSQHSESADRLTKLEDTMHLGLAKNIYIDYISIENSGRCEIF